MRLLLAEDASLVREPLAHALKRAGWAVDVAENGARALELAQSIAYDAVVLDIMMSEVDGLEVLSEIRRAGLQVPVILLTAKNDVRDRVAGLDLGADDYLTKPFHVSELCARLRAVMRRRSVSDPSCHLETLGLSYDPEGRTLRFQGLMVQLAAKEGLVLECLMRHPARVVTRGRVEEAVWGPAPGSAGRLEAQVSLLRAKLRELGTSVRIRSVRGVGYVLEETDDA